MQIFGNKPTVPVVRERIPHEMLDRPINLLLEGIALHAVEVDVTRRLEFKARLLNLETDIRVADSSQALLTTISEALRIVDVYNRDCEQVTKEALSEARLLSQMLLQLLGRQDLSNETRIGLLAALEQIGAAQRAVHFRALRRSLEELFTIPTQMTAAGQGGNESSSQAQPGARKDALQSPTGLPTRSAALEMVSSLIATRSFRYGVALRLDSLATVERRYGDETAQDYLMNAANYIHQSLRKGDRLFHWNSSCLLAVLDRNLPEESVRHELQRISSSKKDLRLNVDGHSIVFCVPLSFDPFPITGSSVLDAVAERVDRFARSRT